MDRYQAPAITNQRQREALRALADMDLTPEELHHAIIFFENLTADGGVNLDNLPEATKLHFAPIVDEWLRELGA